MKDIIEPVDTEDGLFHDGDPSTGAEGTIVYAKIMNSLQGGVISNQQELASVLKGAGIPIDPTKQDQLLTAIKSILSSGTADKAKSADKLTTPRKITGHDFDGTADITITAGDVKALPLAGGTMSGQIALPDTGRGSWANQNANGAPLYQNVNTTASSEYWPIFKQHYVQGNSTWSGGLLINEGDFHLHYVAESGGTTNFRWTKDGQFIPANYANFDSKYQAKGNYTPAGQAYTKAESDGRYQAKGNYTPAGQAYTKAESDAKYQAKGSYTPAGQAYTKAESDARYVQNIRRGPQQLITPGENGIWNGFELGSGYFTGTKNRTDDGNAKFSQYFYRVPQVYIQSKGWVDTGS